jgi:hypothetical protein
MKLRTSLLMLVALVAVTLAATAAFASPNPVGPLPDGPVSTISTKHGQLIAVALPSAPPRSGLVWRVARRYDPAVVREISEANIGRNVIVVFKVVGAGRTAIVFAQTRGDASPKALASITHNVRAS